MTHVLWLDEVADGDRGRVGAKAYILAMLRRQGLPVPDGFVLLAGNGSVQGARRAALAEAYARLGGAVAVRSSSTAEDGADLSFAGQHRTVLDVSGGEAVLDAASLCLASAVDGDGYARALGARPPEAMAVFVQRFVEPRAAGVAFSHDPRETGSLLVESHAGRGEAVVSGRVSPDRYVVDRESRTLRRGPASGCLGTDDLRGVATLALDVEHRLGGPQDVEWAIGKEGLVLLQARPITVEAPDVDVDPRIRRLTRANVGEVLPDPVTPITESTVVAFLEDGFRAVTEGLRPRGTAPFLVLYRRRLYLNLTLCIDVAARLPGVTSAAAESLVLGAGAARGPSAGSTATPRESRALRSRAILRLAGAAVRIAGIELHLARDIEACESLVARLPSRGAIESAGPETLAALLDGFFAAGQRLATTHVATSGSSGVRLAVLGRLLANVAAGDATERVNRLVAALDDVESAAPTVALEAMARNESWRSWLSRSPDDAREAFEAGDAPADIAAAIRAFLGRFGHRAVSEGELRAAAWEDDPRPVFAALRTLAAAPEPALRRRARRETRRADEEALLSRLGPLRRALLRRALRGAREWVRRRERTKSLCIAAVHHGRTIVRAAGRRLVAMRALGGEDDVFFLTLAELRAALRGEPVNRPALERRRRRHEREGGLPAPRDVALDGTRPDADEPAGDPDRLAGVGVSAGVGRGRARVIVAGSEATLEPGEVLVAPVLDAALGPLLASAAGAVAEIGGLLSHGSVVARELGIPCVVDVRGATERLRTGDLVEVDGGSGRVRRIGATASGPAPRALRDREQIDLPSFLSPADPGDERLHTLSGTGQARESVYFNMRDPASGVVLVSSLGVRAGGGGEGLVALGLPDGRVLFGLDLEAARVEGGEWGVGLQSVTWTPLRLRIQGRLSVHETASFPPPPLPLLLAPRTTEVSLDLAFVPSTPAVDFCAGLPEDVLAALRPLGSHHVEQSGVWRGDIVVDGRGFRFEGGGSRDHSWGRRDWEAADHWRLFTLRLGDDLAVHALAVSVNGRLVEGGFVWREGCLERITRVAFAADHTPDFDLEVATTAGPPLRLRGTVLRTITVPVQLEKNPARHLLGRPYRMVLHEGFSRYEGGGRTGFGMAERTERGGGSV